LKQKHQSKGGGTDDRGAGVSVKETASVTLKAKLTEAQIGAISDVCLKVFGELVPQEDEMHARQSICR